MEIVEFKDYPNTETPLSAYNLNRMQNNIKNELTNIEQEGIIVSPTEPTTNRRKVWMQNVDNNEKIHVLNDNNVYEEFMKKHEDIYSTEEQVIGKWIDGKPLYRKVVNIGLLIPNTTTDYPTGLSSVNIKKFEAYFSLGDAVFALNHVNTLDNNVIETIDLLTFNYGATIRVANYKVNSTELNCWVILEYTKTTD